MTHMFLRMMDIFILNAYLSWQNDCILQNYCFRQVVDSRNRTHISNDHEYILAYSQNIDLASLLGKEVSKDKYSNPDNDPRGIWMSNSILGLANAE